MNITYADEGPVRVVTMSGRRDLNVFTPAAHDQLGACLNKADDDDHIRVVILRGNDRSFSVGADIDSFPSPPCDPTPFVETFLQANCLPERLRKPVLAVVHGAAMAGGFELALACDWIFARPAATFSLPEARFGLVAGYAAARLTHTIGTHRARRIMMTGESLTAAEAAELGIPVTPVEDDDPMEAAREMAKQLCQSAPHAVRLIKQRSVANARALDPAFDVSLSAYAQLWNLPDTQEALTAWREKRPARYRQLNDPWKTAAPDTDDAQEPHLTEPPGRR